MVKGNTKARDKKVDILIFTNKKKEDNHPYQSIEEWHVDVLIKISLEPRLIAFDSQYFRFL